MPIDFIIYTLVVFLVGVGVGTFVLGARIRKIVTEQVAFVHKQYADIADKTVAKFEAIKKVL